MRICLTRKNVLMEVVPPLENFHAFVYTVLPFSMLPDRTDQNIVLSGKNVAGLIVVSSLCALYSW
jgi:hypothetical protein